jgi:hypothetical protein
MNLRLGHEVSARALAVLASLAAAMGLGCGGEDVTYSYVRVGVTVSPAVEGNRRNLIRGCAVDVQTPKGEQSYNLKLPMDIMVPLDFGKFEYSTTTAGPVKFIVRGIGINGDLLARGESPSVTLKIGDIVETKVVLEQATPQVR